MITEYRIAQELTEALNRVTTPELKFFCLELPILIRQITLDLPLVAYPFRATWEKVELV